MMRKRLIVIADDFTGATDIGNALVDTGRTVRVRFLNEKTLPIKEQKFNESSSDVEVYALKVRSIAVEDAIERVEEALNYSDYNPERDQLYFKYCSTFDSTPQGNIGPILDHLLRRAGARAAIVAPAFPDNQRTQYMGYLFVKDELLSESSMRNHPITPMTDASIVRLVERQGSGSATLIPLETVRGSDLEGALALGAANHSYLVTDAVTNTDLSRIAEAVETQAVVSGGSGLAQNYPRNGPEARDCIRKIPGSARAVIVGSQSMTTRRQLAYLERSGQAAIFHYDPQKSNDVEFSRLRKWAESSMDQGKLLVVQRPHQDELLDTDEQLSVQIEEFLGRSAALLYEKGVREFVVAGGETSGAVIEILGGSSLVIGAQICPGVPWTRLKLSDSSEINIALKSGNFGEADFFEAAWNVIAES